MRLSTKNFIVLLLGSANCTIPPVISTAVVVTHVPTPIRGNITNIHDPSGIVIGDDGTPMVFSTSHSDVGGINVHMATDSTLATWEWARCVCSS